MDRLWAPWRTGYILGKKTKGCLFCRQKRSKNDRKMFIVTRSKMSFSVLNIYPYNNGHVMVVPNRHVPDLEKLKEDEVKDLFSLLQETVKKLKKILKPDGLNIGLNLGKAAGAGVVGHLHFHVVPRWNGDTNFMPSVSGTKILPESLTTLYERLTKCSAEKSRKKKK